MNFDSDAFDSSLYGQSSMRSMILSRKKRRKQKVFQRDIENLLYSLGDGPVSLDSTVQVLEEILTDYIADLSYHIYMYSKSQGRSRIKVNDLAFVLRNDPLKLSRFDYIIEQSYKIEKAKKMFENKTTNINSDTNLLNLNLDDDEKFNVENNEYESLNKN